MNLFDDSEKKDKGKSDRTKLPEVPDMKEWGAEKRPGNPFALSDWSPGTPANISKP
jgi:hypothetical protein